MLLNGQISFKTFQQKLAIKNCEASCAGPYVSAIQRNFDKEQAHYGQSCTQRASVDLASGDLYEKLVASACLWRRLWLWPLVAMAGDETLEARRRAANGAGNYVPIVISYLRVPYHVLYSRSRVVT
jgi:hypothetical protein